MAGGPKRLPFTVPPLVFSALKLVRRLQGQDGDVAGEEVPATPKKLFQLMNQIIEALSIVPSPELALRLYLQCAEIESETVEAVLQSTSPSLHCKSSSQQWRRGRLEAWADDTEADDGGGCDGAGVIEEREGDGEKRQ
ncbi:unnamed protein product [Fraxinus pennsylvanica]|uniref:Uncharacterized protein n=1 Tax=Fraxinus pennsylvanica TaxID=56036 RepID=A0AAD2DLN1_9LAMI|nr:unnamed protein product [Fraxinus pennsylvanica]